MELTKLLIFSLSLLCLFNLSKENAEADLVTDLPYYEYKGRLYSGYLEVDREKQFHYMFNLADENPDSKPLVLWMNGGPGCSSLDGWANEHGPMRIIGPNKFEKNEYSWNKVANMIYLESPGDVGFSYIDSNLDYKKAINDEIAAKDNLQALLSFFKKFPSYKGRDFYISGESYAGIYVPTLAYKILQYNKEQPKSQQINLKGILVGNGVADWNYDTDNAMIEFAFTHHLYSYKTREDYNQYCILTKDEQKCSDVMDKIEKNLETINIYDYLRECYIPMTSSGEIDKQSAYYKRAPYAFKRYEKYIQNKKKSKNYGFLGYLLREKLYDEQVELAVPCIDDTNIENYFNLAEVKTALHVKSTIKYSVCSTEVNQRYEVLDKGSYWTYEHLIAAGVRILIYSGDTDLAVPFNGNIKWIQNLKLETIQEYKQWRAYSDPRNVSGYYVKYKGLTFFTIKGTGHMSPQWKPKEALYMFDAFINNKC